MPEMVYRPFLCLFAERKNALKLSHAVKFVLSQRTSIKMKQIDVKMKHVLEYITPLRREHGKMKRIKLTNRLTSKKRNNNDNIARKSHHLILK